MEQEHCTEKIEKFPWLAALLSLLLPGLGHFYIGQIKNAIGFHAGLWILIFLFWFTPIGYTFSGLIIVIFLLMIYLVIITANAFVAAKSKKMTVHRKYDKWYVYLLIIVLAGIFIEYAIMPFNKQFAKIKFASSLSSVMEPTLPRKDEFAWKRTQNIIKGDIAVFEFPDEPNALYVFRCVAIPGDKLEVREGLVYINDKLYDKPELLKFTYRIITDGNLNLTLLEEHGIKEVYKISGQNYFGLLSLKEVEEMKKTQNVVEVLPEFKLPGLRMNDLFPFDSNIKWNIDYYGPVVVPEKGKPIEITKENASFYNNLIRMSENNSGIMLNDQGLLERNGEIIKSFAFNEDYFFMMGDNRHNAADSRYRGPVPRNLINGKVLYIWWSEAKERIGKNL